MSKAEEFIKEHTKYYSNDITRMWRFDHVYNPWLTPEQAKKAVEIAKEEVIEKAISFIKQTSKGLERDEDVKQFVKDLKESMRKEE